MQGSTCSKGGDYQSEKGNKKRAHRGSHHDLTTDRNPCDFRSDGVFGNHSGVQAVEVVPETTEAPAVGAEAGGGPLFQPPKTGAVAIAARERTLTIRGEIPTEIWNRLGRTLIPKLKTGNELVMKLDVSVQVGNDTAQSFQQELMQILRDLNLADSVRIEIE